ncbi:hypothetical protein [Devosia sp. LC5]|uniref:hypothetical protein n=1 Tax=Devosia sp. LC5 TaxID=1502724 RepID=UPI0012695233|nr:hypothetical protein [Devosia sp. LC5]
MSDYDPIVVGGQCISMWVDYLAQFDREIALLGSVSSADVDYYENPKAAEKLAESLKGNVLLPDDALNLSANSCTVTAFVNGKRIHIDFMREVIGVDAKNITGRYVAIEGNFPNIETPVRLALMHPLDCVQSRLANIETLDRTDRWSLIQTDASFKVLRAFIDHLLSLGEVKEATRTIQQFEYVLKERFYRPYVYPFVVGRISPIVMLNRYLDETLIDVRWRDHTLTNIIERLAAYEETVRKRLGLA